MSTGKDQTGVVFNIQHFSVHDGPGIRTIVFLKGCPLRCRWCCNPESQDPRPEVTFDPKKCIGTAECGLCLQCPQGAVTADETGITGINRELCDNCGECAAKCPSRALEMIGSRMSVKEVLEAVEKDFCFYSRSGGGLTLSGGEPFFQGEFAVELLKNAKFNGMDTAVETCGHVPWEVLEKALPYVNAMMFDIKCIDPAKHEDLTGVSNRLILDNFARICRHFPRLSKTVRTPIIPGLNDDPEDIRKIVDFIRPFSGLKFELLPYHRFGEPKYTFLGKTYPLPGVSAPEEARMQRLRNIADNRG